MVSDNVIVAMIVAIPPTIASVCGVVISLINSRKIHLLHLHVNSRLDALVTETGRSQFAEGKAQGMEEERRRLIEP
jgi:hypothetical protein